MADETLLARTILALLDAANDSPPVLERRAFYALKRRLLERYAMPDGVDIQYIEDECWDCRGEGCSRCDKGIYRRRFNELRRWRWGRHSFHTWERQLPTPPSLPSIKGRIYHVNRRRYYLGDEAWYWLALIYDRPAFWRSFGHCGHLGKRFTPLVILATLWFNCRLAWNRARNWWRRLREHDDLPF